MNKYKVIANFTAAGATIPAGNTDSQPREGRFMANDEILGQPIVKGDDHGWAHSKGYNFIHEGIYWNMPGNYLQLIQENVPGTSESNTGVAEGTTGGVKPDKGSQSSSGSSVPANAKPLLHGVDFTAIKNSKLTLYAGAGLGGVIGYQFSNSIELLPGGLNKVLFIGLGMIGGYWGTQKLVEKL